jgi:hypothetical protein
MLAITIINSGLAFLTEMNNHIENNNMKIKNIDLRGFGLWGEWHTGFLYGSLKTNSAPANSQPTFNNAVATKCSALQSVLNIWSTCLPNHWLSLSYSYDPDDAAIAASSSLYSYYKSYSLYDLVTNYANITIRRDGVGPEGLTALQLNEKTFNTEIWNTTRSTGCGPITAETANGYSSYKSNTASLGKTIEQLCTGAIDEGVSQHANLFTIIGWAGLDAMSFISEQPSLENYGLNNMGYRLVPTSIGFTSNVGTDRIVALNSSWVNRAAGHAIQNYSLRLILNDASGNKVTELDFGNSGSNGWNKGTTYSLNDYKASIPSNIAAGNYRACIALYSSTDNKYIELPINNASLSNEQGYYIGQLTINTNSASTNFALGKTVTSSSSLESGNWSRNYAVDGTMSGLWTSNDNFTVNHTEWITIDMGSSYNIGTVNLTSRPDLPGDGFPIDFTISVSTDNVNWNTVVTAVGYSKPDARAQYFSFPAQNARYVKITGTNLRPITGEGNYRMQFAEIEVNASQTNANFAQNKSVTASSSYEGGNWSTAYAVDGSFSGWWTSSNSLTSNHTEWITIDLGSPYYMQKVNLYARPDLPGDGFPIDFTISVSNDNTNWVTVKTISGYSKPASNAQIFAFPTNNARYIKITGTSLRPIASESNHYRMQFAEIQIY